MPSCSICSNSSLAVWSFSASSRRNLLAIGGPLVEMKCSTLFEEGGKTLADLATSGNSSRMIPSMDPGSKAIKRGQLGDGGHSPAGRANLAATSWRKWCLLLCFHLQKESLPYS
jgi:hypothetical protein